MPGPVTKLQRSFAYRVSKIFPNGMLRWMDVVSGAIDNLTGGTQAQERFVNKAGSDITGNGSFDKPFLTIQAAINSITDAAANKRYTVFVSPGDTWGNFTLKPFVYVQGAGQGQTFLDPTPAQALAASFAGGGVKESGISFATIAGALVTDLAVIGATGSNRLEFRSLLVTGLINVKGANSTDTVALDDITPLSTVAITNWSGAIINDVTSDLFAGTWALNSTDAFLSVYTVTGSGASGATVTWTGANAANAFLVSFFNSGFLGSVTVVGKGAAVSGLFTRSVALTDANQDIGFYNDATATDIAINGAFNEYTILPTVQRTITVRFPSITPTHLIIKNRGTVAVLLSFPAATAVGPTYIPPGAEVTIRSTAGATDWSVSSTTQQSLAVIAGGVSAALIPADVSIKTSFQATLATFNGVAGTPYMKSADTVVGTFAGGGGFKIHSINPATGADLATDNGTYWWTASGL